MVGIEKEKTTSAVWLGTDDTTTIPEGRTSTPLTLDVAGETGVAVDSDPPADEELAPAFVANPPDCAVGSDSNPDAVSCIVWLAVAAPEEIGDLSVAGEPDPIEDDVEV